MRILLAFAILASAASASSPGDYRIGVRDLLRFQVYEEPDTLIVQRVSSSGEIPLPLLGVVKVAGLTLREAENAVRRAYMERELFVDPQVLLTLEEYHERSVSVLGQVARPEQVSFPLEESSLGLVHAITMAGGFTRLAKTDQVQVTRRSSDGERSFTVDVESYLANRKARSADEFLLLPGDIVFVPERSF